MKALNQDQIFLRHPTFSEIEEVYAVDALRSASMGATQKYIYLFEDAIAEVVGCGPVVAISSATAALHVGLRLLGVKAGDEVMCSTFTYMASANPIKYMDGVPVFVDCEAGSWQLDVGLLEEVFKRRANKNGLPKVLIVANIFGQCGRMDELMELCGAYGVQVLEDAAQCLGGFYKGRAMGLWGDLGVYSFNGNKIVTTSGGGALVGRDETLLSRARHLINQAKLPGSGFVHDEVGYNYSLSNILAAVGLGQMETLSSYVRRAREIYENYKLLLEGVEGIEFAEDDTDVEGTRWLSALLLPEGVNVEEVVARMQDFRIEVRRLWKPLHLQKPFMGAEVIGGDVAEGLWGRGLCLPSSSTMSYEQQEYVAECLKASIGMN